MKQIEEGCLAIVVKSSDMNSPNIGRVGRVGRFVGEIPNSWWKDWWEFSAHCVYTQGPKKGQWDNLQREEFLQRLDDFDFSKEKEEAEELVIR